MSAFAGERRGGPVVSCGRPRRSPRRSRSGARRPRCRSARPGAAACSRCRSPAARCAAAPRARTPTPAARAPPRPTTAMSRRAPHASERFPPASECEDRRARRRPRRRSARSIASVELAAAAERRLRLDRRRRRVGRLRPRPVDDRAVGVGLPDVERVRLASRRAARGTRTPSPRRSAPCRRVQVTFWITALSPRAGLLHRALPAGRRHERVDAEPGRHGELDLRRRAPRPSPSGPRA